jgi:hypothetical protein
MSELVGAIARIKCLGSFGSPRPVPFAVAVDIRNNVYVVSDIDGRIHKITPAKTGKKK